MCHPEERGRRAEGSFFVRNIWEALYLERCLRCRHDKQFNVFMSKHLVQQESIFNFVLAPDS